VNLELSAQKARPSLHAANSQTYLIPHFLRIESHAFVNHGGNARFNSFGGQEVIFTMQ